MERNIDNVPVAVQAQMVKLEQLQKQGQAVIAQRMQLEGILRDSVVGLAALEKVGDSARISKIIGNIIVESDKKTVIADLEEQKRLVESRLSVLEVQENHIRGQFDQIQKQIKEYLEDRKTDVSGGIPDANRVT